jgi:hypothetical protein
MRVGCDLFVSERGRPTLSVRLRRVLELLPGLLVSCQVVLFSMLLGRKMSRCPAFVQFAGTLMVLVV